jgi:hypothetical protein
VTPGVTNLILFWWEADLVLVYSDPCFPDMMKDSPGLMTEALLIHNRLIREAKWTNFGFTVEQEGGEELSLHLLV